MAEFVYAKHAGIEGLAFVSKDALDHLPGWTEVADPDAENKKQARAHKD